MPKPATGAYVQTFGGPIDFGTITLDNAVVTGGNPHVDVSAFATLQAGLTAAAGGVALFPAGFNPTISTQLVVPKNTVLRFNGNTLTTGTAASTAPFLIQNADISVEGSYTVAGASIKSPFWQGVSGGDRFVHRAKAVVAGISHNTSVNDNNYFIWFANTNVLRIGGGVITSTDSLLVKTDKCNHVLVQDISAGAYTVDNGSNSIIYLGDFGQSAPAATGFNDIKVLNCHVDGGSVLSGYAGIAVAQTFGGGTHGRNVEITNCSVEATLSNADGIDVVQCDQVTVSNCNVNGVGNGLDIAGCSQVQGYGGTALNCRNAGLQIGDTTVAFQTNFVTINGFICVDCGIGGQVDFTAAGIVIFAPAGSSTNVVDLNGCQSYKNTNANMKYGIGFGNGSGGTFAVIRIDGGFLNGNTSAFLDSSTGTPNTGFRFSSVGGVNPRAGGPSTPAVATPTTNTGQADAFVTFIANAAGTTVTVAGKALSATPANAEGFFFIPAGSAVSYNNAPASWAWFWL